MSWRTMRAWMEVDLDAIVRNAHAAKERAGVPLIPMLKADAYGLGAERVAAALEAVDPLAYGIATVAEGKALRHAAIVRPLIVFTPLLSLTPTLGSIDEISAWRSIGDAWHLSIDTGMSRAGAEWRDVEKLSEAISRDTPEGAFTHFHSAELNDGSMAEQEERFRDALSILPVRPGVLHTDASAAIARHGKSEWDAIRPGIFLYGVGSGPGAAIMPEPVVTVRARIVETRWIEAGDAVSYDATYRAPSRRRIATLPMGYADGYPRILGNRALALTNDGAVPVVGLVTMDMIMLDVTDSAAEVGDDVTLIGRDKANAGVAMERLSELAHMSAYEMMTGLRGRLERFYTGE
jgi:alanine racemase